MAEPLRQLNKPLAVPARLDPDQRWRLQGLIEPFRLSFPVLQLVLDDLAGLHIENRYLLPARMEITSYNLHRRLLLIQQLKVLNQNYSIAEAFVLIPSRSRF